MILVRPLKIDGVGRIIVTDYYKGRVIPKDVCISYDPTNGELILSEDSDNPVRRRIDTKKRVYVPAKTKEYFKIEVLYLYYDTDKKRMRIFDHIL